MTDQSLTISPALAPYIERVATAICQGLYPEATAAGRTWEQFPAATRQHLRFVAQGVLVAIAPAVDPWTRVGEGLPEQPGPCLAMFAEDNEFGLTTSYPIQVSYREFIGKEFTYFDSWREESVSIDDQITHWMPMPRAPLPAVAAGDSAQLDMLASQAIDAALGPRGIAGLMGVDVQEAIPMYPSRPVHPAQEWAWWVSSCDELDDLAPAQLIAGQVLDTVDGTPLVVKDHQAKHLAKPWRARLSMLLVALKAAARREY